jgi:hypothetical protein
MNTLIPLQTGATPHRIGTNLMPPLPATTPKIRRALRAVGHGRWPQAVTESWETGVTLLHLVSRLPLLGVLRGLSAIAGAAEARHVRK